MTAINKDSNTNRDGTAVYVAGPLNLNRDTKKACTVMGTNLALTNNEFDALYTLATHEGESITLEQLHKAVWGKDAAHEATQMGLNHLVNQVGEAGEGFMWIEQHPKTGYTFHARWGHNWKDYAKPIAEMHYPPLVEPRRWHKKVSKTLISGTAILAASIALFAMLVQARTEPTIYIADEPVPLAAMYAEEIEPDAIQELDSKLDYITSH
ncbi:MAG: winged helix-turn-helix domain-containing protein [Defluviitaleaceae bacterium]|nr:winged helix-turn-helix domain-containing protein [Defluviitaleaceae bacterium]